MMTTGKFYTKRPLDPPVDFNRISNRDFVAICAQCHMQSNVHQGSPHGELNYSSTDTFFLKNAAVPLGEFTRARLLQRWTVKPDDFYGRGAGAFAMLSQEARPLAVPATIRMDTTNRPT